MLCIFNPNKKLLLGLNKKGLMRLTISVIYSESGSELDSNFSVNSSESESKSESESNSNSMFINLDIYIFFILYLHSSK